MVPRVSPPQKEHYYVNRPPVPYQAVDYLQPQYIVKKQTRNPETIDEKKLNTQRGTVAAPVKNNLEEEYRNLQQ